MALACAGGSPIFAQGMIKSYRDKRIVFPKTVNDSVYLVETFLRPDNRSCRPLFTGVSSLYPEMYPPACSISRVL